MSFGDKYVFELYGSFLLILIYFVSKIKNVIKVAIIYFLFLAVNFNFKDHYIVKNNSFSEIINTLQESISNTSNDFKEKFCFDNNYKEYLLSINESSNDGSFKLKHLLNYSSFPNYIVFMESSFNKLNEFEKSEIFKFFKIDFHMKETIEAYEYLILSLK